MYVCIFRRYIHVYAKFWSSRVQEKLASHKVWNFGSLLLAAAMNKSWRQHQTKQQLYGHLPPITKTIKVKLTRHAGHCWRSKDELISNVLLWTSSHGRPAWTYIQQLCADTGYSLEDQPGAMDDRDEWQKKVREINAVSAKSGWCWWLLASFTHRCQLVVWVTASLSVSRILLSILADLNNVV